MVLGYKQSGFVTRKVGREKVRFSTYSPKVIAGIAREKMPVEGATLTRCISIKLMKALQSEVKKFRPRQPLTKADLDAISEWVKSWAEMHGPALGDAYLEVPTSIGNRAAELWEPLLAIAEALGDDIAAEARQWAEALQGQAEKAVDPNVAFLSDLRTALEGWIPEREIDKDHRRTSRIRVADIHKRWLALEERSFTEKLDLNRFSRRIAAFGIKSTPDKGSRWFRVLDAEGGFAPEWADTFARYAPEPEAQEDQAEDAE